MLVCWRYARDVALIKLACVVCKRGSYLTHRCAVRDQDSRPLCIPRELASTVFENKDLVVQFCPSCLALRGTH